MGFKNMKRDDHGHVISNDEVDGQKCKHASGQADKVEDQKYNKEMKEAQEQNAAMSEAFDDDYEEEFEDDPAGHALDVVESELHINVLESKENLEDAKRWLVANGYAKSHMEAQDLIESALSDEGKAKLNKLLGFDEDDEFDESQEEYEARIKPEAEKFKKQLDDAGYKLKDKEYGLEQAIKNADDDVLDDYFGKDTSERKLAGAMKGGSNPPTPPEGPDNPPIRDKELDQAMLNSKPRMGLYDSREVPQGSSYIETSGRFIAPDNGSKMTHDDINKAMNMDLYNDKQLIALNSGVYGSRIASIDIPKGKQVTDAEWNSIKTFIDKAKAEGKTIDFGHGPYNTKDYDTEDILAMIKRKHK